MEHLTTVDGRAHVSAGQRPGSGGRCPWRGPSGRAPTVAADGIGAVSVLLGTLLVVAPRSGGARLGLDDVGGVPNRVLGVADLALGIAIIVGRRASWRWTVVGARSVLHLVFAREYLRRDRRRAAAGMCALFVVDSGVVAALAKRPA